MHRVHLLAWMCRRSGTRHAACLANSGPWPIQSLAIAHKMHRAPIIMHHVRVDCHQAKECQCWTPVRDTQHTNQHCTNKKHHECMQHRALDSSTVLLPLAAKNCKPMPAAIAIETNHILPIVQTKQQCITPNETAVLAEAWRGPV